MNALVLYWQQLLGSRKEVALLTSKNIRALEVDFKNASVGLEKVSVYINKKGLRG